MGSRPGLGACALTHLTAGAQTLKHHKPEVQGDKRVNLSCESAAFALLKHLWCSKTLLSSCNTPTTFTDYVQKHFILHQKHYSTICLQLNIPLLCFASAVKEKKNLASWFISKKHSLGSFLGDMKGNLGRPHFFPWGQFARHSKKNVSSQRASTNWPDIQLILICIGEQLAAGQTRNSTVCNK